MISLTKTIAIDFIKNTVNGNNVARIFICHDGKGTQVYESLTNAAIESFNSWLAEGYTAVHPYQLKVHTSLYR